MTSRWRLLRWVVLCAGTLAASATGCEVLVPGDVPSYACTSSPGACPAGEVCFVATSTCVQQGAICGLLNCPAPGVCDATLGKCVGSNVLDDAGTDSDVGAVVDAGSDVDSSVPPPVRDSGASAPDADAATTTPPDASPFCGAIGCPCAGPSNCASGICGDSLDLTPALIAATKENVCTQGCCTSADCGAGNVCFAAATGGNYCVNASVVGRTLGELPTLGAGAACTASADCLSGLCSGNICVDTCCSATTCATGTQCMQGKFPGVVSFDDHETYFCQAPGSGSLAAGASCEQSSQCASNLCGAASGSGFSGNECLEACRDSAACGTGSSCIDLIYPGGSASSNDVLVVCATSGNGTVVTGGACTKDSECVSDSCDTSISACVDVCVSNGDCAAAPGWTCIPTTVTLPQGGSFSVLTCQPP